MSNDLIVCYGCVGLYVIKPTNDKRDFILVCTKYNQLCKNCAYKCTLDNLWS